MKPNPLQTTPIPNRLYFRIGDVADLAGVKPYVLRYWESEFPIITPEKSPSGQRVYRRSDVETVLLIKHLLYTERYSIEGARKRIRELRREGEFKAFKQEKVSQREMQGDWNQFLKTALELRALVNTPLEEIFRY